MKNLVKIAFATLVLAGCGAAPPPIQPVEVSIPVEVACSVDDIPPPDWNVPKLSPGASTADKIKAAFADLELSRGYIEELQAEVAGCS